MSKRKIGGYEMSSDEESGEESAPATNPPKAKTYAPPRLSAPAFKHPKNSRHPQHLQSAPSNPKTPSARSQTTVMPGQKPSATSTLRTAFPTPRETPQAVAAGRGDAWDDLDEQLSDAAAPASPVVDARAKGKGPAPNAGAGPSNPHNAPSQPSMTRFGVEREVHDLSVSIAECMSKEEDHDCEIVSLRKEVARLHEEVKGLTKTITENIQAQETWKAQLVLNTPAPAPAHIASAAPAAPAAASSNYPPGSVESVMAPNTTFNPRIDVESVVPINDIKTIATIISGTKHRKLNTRPAIPEVGQIKTHLRKMAYDTLDGVTSGSTVKPYFVDRNGQHDLWPAEFADPVTKQTPAYPNWDKSLDGQAAWVALVLARFRATVPKSKSEFSMTARTIAEDLLVEMFIDGPWSTMKLGWKGQNKSEEQIDEARRAIRRGKRPVAKAGNRAEWWQEVLELEGEECDFLVHEAYQLAKESDL
ncbi:hypothetical protein FRC06_008798 [Ceratobasidium sp. 370]|nr:hypothetical protein FRC06_008798 [Ceratobasidium sp. 370]